MFVKQIDEKEALRLYQDGVDVKIMYPSLTDSGDLDWMGMEHDTLQAMLDRCMFFRTEPAAVDSDFEMVFQEREENPPPMLMEQLRSLLGEQRNCPANV